MAGKHGRPYTTLDIQKLKRLYHEGVTVKRIALELDRNIGSVLSKMNRLGLCDRRSKNKIRVSLMLGRDEVARIDRQARLMGKTRSAYMRFVLQVYLRDIL